LAGTGGDLRSATHPILPAYDRGQFRSRSRISVLLTPGGRIRILTEYESRRERSRRVVFGVRNEVNPRKVSGPETAC
jgi:hypothetical protein